MPVPVPAGVVFSYNGYTFGPYIKTNVTEEAVAGSGDRQVKYSKFTIKVDGWLTQADADAFAAAQNPPLASGLTLDGFMLALRRILQRHGKPLQYVNKGMGVDLNIGPAGFIRDVAFGPRAGEFHWKPLGGAPDGCHGATFDWTVTFTIQECAVGHFTPAVGNFTDMTFTVAYDTGEDGLVTITMNGKAEIPLSLNAAGGIDHQIDEYFAAAVAPPPVGFLRKMHRTLSADRRSCDFTITDRQIEIAYPSNVVEIDAKFKVKSTNRANVSWIATMTATIRLAPGTERAVAWFRFLAMERARIRTAQAAVLTFVSGAPVRATVVPITIEMEEDMFKNTSRFTASYQIVKADLTNIIRASGLWSPVVDGGGGGPNGRFLDFGRWQTSIIGNAQATLGGIGAKFDKSQDVIIDACPNAAPIIVAGASETAGTGGGDAGGGDWSTGDAGGGDWGTDLTNIAEPIVLLDGGDTGSASDGTPAPVAFYGPDDVGARADAGGGGWGTTDTVNPAASWLDWTCSVRRIVDYKMIRHKPLSGQATTNTPPFDITAAGSEAQVADDVTPDSIGFTSTVPDIVQQVAAPSVTLELRGHAIRLGFTINAPKLISFGGVAAILAHEDVTPTTLANPDGNVYYRLDWVLTYIIPAAPATISQVANPYIQTDGQP
jgi:hypothetical protein